MKGKPDPPSTPKNSATAEALPELIASPGLSTVNNETSFMTDNQSVANSTATAATSNVHARTGIGSSAPASPPIPPEMQRISTAIIDTDSQSISGDTTSTPKSSNISATSSNIRDANKNRNTFTNTMQRTTQILHPNSLLEATTQTTQAATQATQQMTQQLTENVTSGVNQVVDWTAKNMETAYGDRGLRPMHVRVSVRVHHVAFLHPGLDNGSGSGSGGGVGSGGNDSGGRRLIHNRGLGGGGGGGLTSRWRKKNTTTTATATPGLLKLGAKKGTWKNPKHYGKSHFKGSNHSGGVAGAAGPSSGGTSGGGGVGTNPTINTTKHRHRSDLDSFHVEEEMINPMDAADISEVVSAEAFRLSRDGIIQQHYALTSHWNREESTRNTNTMQQSSFRQGSGRSAMALHHTDSTNVIPTPTNNDRNNFNKMNNSIRSSLISPKFSSSNRNLADASRYYQECAQRPKGYRRLVVSSSMPTDISGGGGGGHLMVPRPPALARKMGNAVGSGVGRSLGAFKPKGSGGSSVGVSGSMRRGGSSFDQHSNKSSRKRGTWDFEVDSSSMDHGSFRSNNRDGTDGYRNSPSSKRTNRGSNLSTFNDDGNNENLFDNVEYQYIGPARTGPEFFQLLRYHGGATFGRYLPELACSVPKHSIGFELLKSKRRAASTQPIVAEAPHIIWGDARDKMLSRIAREGCPFIDAREFEYVSNTALNETELSESLMICGATIWVENAPEEATGEKGGSVMTTSSPVKHTHATKNMIKAEYYGGQIAEGFKDGFRGVAKGTKEVLSAADKVGKKLVPHHSKGSEDASSVVSDATQDSVTRKKHKLSGMFKPKKVKNIFKKGRKRRESDDGRSVDGSIVSSAGHEENMSVAGESVTGERVIDALIRADTDEIGEQDFEKEEPGDAGISHSDEDASHHELDHQRTLDVSVAASTMDQSVATVDKTEADNQTVTAKYSVVKPVPYVILADDIIDIQIVSFPDSDVIAKFPISVTSVLVQRSMEDRMNDPMKPSELTATLIQEPSAPELKWGVELKITVRAVEVKPQVPRVLPIPDFKMGEKVISMDRELAKFRDGLMNMGKTEEEIKKEIESKKDEISKQENELDNAIVAAGMGKGEDQGVGLDEVRLRQMFYDDREHQTIVRKFQRREELRSSERKLMHDARIDPSASLVEHDENDIQLLLDINFPGVEEGYTSVVKNRLTVSGTPTLGTISEADSTKSEPPPLESLSSKGVNLDVDPASDTLASVSLALAHSLDTCLSEFINEPTVPLVQQNVNRFRHATTDGARPVITREVTKQWCSEVAKKVSSCASSVSETDEDVRRTAAYLQNIVARSACSLDVSMMSVDLPIPLEPTAEGSSKDSFQIAKMGSVTSVSDSTKLADWCTEVATKLEECAEELDDVVVDSKLQRAVENTAKPDPEGRMSIGHEDSLVDDVSKTEFTLASVDVINKSAKNQTYRRASSSSILSIFTGRKSEENDSDSDDSSKQLSPRQQEPEETVLPSNARRLLNSTSISTIKQAIPGAKPTHSYDVTSLLKSMKDSHYQMHRSLPNDMNIASYRSSPPFLRQGDESSVKTAQVVNSILLSDRTEDSKASRSWLLISLYVVVIVSVFVLGVFTASKFDLANREL